MEVKQLDWLIALTKNYSYEVSSEAIISVRPNIINDISKLLTWWDKFDRSCIRDANDKNRRTSGKQLQEKTTELDGLLKNIGSIVNG